MGCGAETEANELMTALLAGVSFTIPEVDLGAPEYQLPDIGEIGDPVSKLTNADLTSGAVEGAGTFDVMMKALGAHLQLQFDKGRITGEQYSKVYVELTQGAMANAVQFLLGRDQAYWQAVAAQMQAQVAQAQVVTARVELETAKVKLQALRYETLAQQANYALAKMKLSTESVAYCTGQYTLDNILPMQKLLVSEQAEAQRAQTQDTRSDQITPVVGLIGKQKDLYSQQITSYKRDSEVKAAKLFTDAWITMKTIDEGLLPPNNFANASLDDILATLKTVNELS